MRKLFIILFTLITSITFAQKRVFGDLIIHGKTTMKDTNIVEKGIRFPDGSVSISALADTVSTAQGATNSNATITTVSDGVYAAIVLTGFTADAFTKRFTLTTAVNGIWTYDDAQPLSSILSASITGLKTGAAANYRFAISINGAIPVFVTAIFTPMEVKNTKVQVTLAFPVSLVQSDTIQIMLAGDGTGDNITITDISMLIR